MFRRLSLSFAIALLASQAYGQDTETSEKLKEAWYGKLQLGTIEPIMQFRIVTKPSGETAAYFDSVTEEALGFDATWSIEGDQLSFDVPKIRLTYRGTLDSSGQSAEGTWSQGGRDLPLVLTKHSEAYSNKNLWENRPQRPVGPFPYNAEEVVFDNTVDGISLAGTLTIPQTPGPHPAVVLITGSGPQDRDQSLMGHKPFMVLADYLTRRGIAVLRYDDRGTAESTGKFRGSTTEDFARDAAAAVDFLANHNQIDAKNIGLAGHSEGGLVAPMVVGLRDDIAFVALLAATGVDGAKIILSQTEAMLRANGVDESQIELSMKVNGAALDVVTNAQPGEDFSAELERAFEEVIASLPDDLREESAEELRSQLPFVKKRFQDRWTRFFINYDPKPALANIQCPVLAIIGSKDLQVLPDLNMPEIEDALYTAGNKDFEMVTLEGLNHLFQECETGAMTEYSSIQETFNPVAMEKIGDWIVKHTLTTDLEE